MSVEFSLAWTLFAALVLWGGINDVCRYTIPNEVSAGLVVTFFAVFLFGPATTLWPHLAIAALILGATFALFLGGVFGAGDAKMMSAVALWAGPGGLLSFVGAVALAGVVILAVLLPVRCAYVAAGKRNGVPDDRIPRLFRKRSGVPYGIAIAAGALLAAPSFDPSLWIF